MYVCMYIRAFVCVCGGDLFTTRLLAETSLAGLKMEKKAKGTEGSLNF